jgi:hypothetical protein
VPVLLSEDILRPRLVLDVVCNGGRGELRRGRSSARRLAASLAAHSVGGGGGGGGSEMTNKHGWTQFRIFRGQGTLGSSW